MCLFSFFYSPSPHQVPAGTRAPQARNAKNPPINRPSKYKPPGACTRTDYPQIQNKKSKKCTVTQKFFHFAKELLRMPNDWSQKVSQYIAVCVVQSSVFAWISSIHIDKVVHG